MNNVRLGASPLQVTPICLGTMTFGEQVTEATAHSILDRSLERGVNFLDAAEMYSVPARAETSGSTETILGTWFAKHPGVRDKVVLATKVAGPARGMPWLRAEVSKAGIVEACEASLRRLQTDVIDLYQIHWPARNVPVFGQLYYDPAKDKPCASIHAWRERGLGSPGCMQLGFCATGLSGEFTHQSRHRDLAASRGLIGEPRRAQPASGLQSHNGLPARHQVLAQVSRE